METITITRTGDAPLRFEGEQIATAGGQMFAGREQNRWHELTLYRTAGGQYVAAVNFATQWEGEPSHCVTYVGDAAALRYAMCDHDPIPPRVGFPSGNQYADRQASLVASLLAQYDEAVGELLTEAGDTFVVCLNGDSDGSDCFDAVAIASFVRAEIGTLGLSHAEAMAICDANSGAMLIGDAPWIGIGANVADADRLDGLGKKWEVDAVALAARIFDAPRGVQFAMAWACAQFWRRCDMETDVALAEAGFAWSAADANA